MSLARGFRPLALVVGGLIAGSQAIAQAPFPPGQVPPPPRFGPGPGFDRPGSDGPFARPRDRLPEGVHWGAAPRFLAGLHLSEDQDDKVFAIIYKAAPAIREQTKARRHAQEALAKLGMSTQFDEHDARELADRASKAESELTLLRLRTEHEIFLVLTPEQREQLQKRARERRPRGPEPTPPLP